MSEEIGIALLGLGNVGRGAYRILEEHAEDIEARLSARVRVRHVLVRNTARAGLPFGLAERLTTDPEKLFADPKVKVIVELIGGNSGFGFLLNSARQQFDSVTVFAVIGLIVAFVYCAERFVFVPLQRRVQRHYGTV